MIGKIISHYRIVEHLGGGGKGVAKDREIRCQTPSALRANLERLKRDTNSSRSEAADAAAVCETSQTSGSVVATSLIKRHAKAAIRGVALVSALVALAWFPLPLKASAELTEKQLTFNSGENPVGKAAISPDSKYLAYSDTAGIHVRRLSTGKERLIPRPAGVPASAYWNLDSWFPDGTHLLANADEPGGQKSTWTVSVLGQLPRKLREGASGFGASPDGTRIAFSPRGTSDDVREIWVMRSQGDNPQKVLAVAENESLYRVHWSPDGQRLAYLRIRRISDRHLCSIETCDLKGASRTMVVSALVLNLLVLEDFCWLPEGRIVYARLDPPNSSEGTLWQIGIDTHAGMPTGTPKSITQWAGSRLGGLSASADGKRLVLLKATRQGQAYLGQLEAGGTRMKPPRRLTNDEEFVDPTAWTPDSKAVLFDSHHNGPSGGIFKQGISQDTYEPVFVAPQKHVVSPCVSADGAWILFMEWGNPPTNPDAPQRLMRIPVSGGVPQLVLETRGWVDFRCARTPANLCVILEPRQGGKQIMITAFDPLKGRGKVLRTIENDPSHHSALSPDGSTLAISRASESEIHIGLLSLSGGSDREITVQSGPDVAGLDWSPDGKGLYCGSAAPQGRTLLYVDLKGNARVLGKYAAGGVLWGVPSPDGRYLAIGGAGNDSNVWLVEGF